MTLDSCKHGVSTSSKQHVASGAPSVIATCILSRLCKVLLQAHPILQHTRKVRTFGLVGR